ncbi:MAG: nucleotide sugar dehydrogenase, partial [Vampirovibrionales bacterium]|nr:nucleotide sugar dehydrogenase [Vampirovibrionales bacterium]
MPFTPNSPQSQQLSPANANDTALATPVHDICVLGLGYVGYPTALLFAKTGFNVLGVDVNAEHLARCSAGCPYPELYAWWHAWQNAPASASSQFEFKAAPAPAQTYIIAVPTPVDAKTKQCDLTAVTQAAASIARVMPKGALVILESTVPPGTTRNVLVPTLENSGLKAGVDFDVAICPERVLPGNICHELIHNQRIVGGYTPQAAERAKALFERVIEAQVLTTDETTAEFCKLAENTYRDVNIALANELSLVAEHLGIEIQAARALMNAHPRVNLLSPGIGVGGHCIAVDPWFFAELAPDKTPLIQTARAINDAMPAYWSQKVLADLEHLRQNTQSPVRILALGAAYKPNIGDCRESPALKIIAHLQAAGCEVTVYDPHVPQYSQPSENTIPENTLPDWTTLCRDKDYILGLVPHDA